MLRQARQFYKINQLKSDLRGIEMPERKILSIGTIWLKSDLRGIEISYGRINRDGVKQLKSDLRGIEMLN